MLYIKTVQKNSFFLESELIWMAKQVLITGGAKGLGASIAEIFASNHYDVIITYLNSETEARELCNFLKSKYNINAESYKLDIRNEADIKDLILKIKNLNCLVNNAAYNNDCNIFEHTKDEFMKVLEINLVGPFILSKYCYDKLCESNGSIVNVASKNGIDTFYPESVDYDSSKAGLINLTKNMAASFAPNVRVNAVAPGWINTHNTIDMNERFKKVEISKILLNRFADPSEIAKLVYFLGVEATYMTGSIVECDGGIR